MKSRKERAKDIIFVLVCVYVFARLALPEQYMLLRSGVLGKQVLWEESCRDTFYGEEQAKVFLYQSHDGKKLGMLSMSKGRFLLWERYTAYRREEVDFAGKTWTGRTNARRLQDLWREVPKTLRVAHGEETAVFQEVYRNFPDGMEGESVLRYVCCGRVDKGNQPEWFRELEREEFRYRREEGAYIYFYVDLPERPAYGEDG